MNVYFIRAGEYVKIGIAKDIKSRIAELQTGQAMKIEFCGAIRHLEKDQALRYERNLHKFFYNSKAEGEWFMLPKFESYDEDSKIMIYGDGGFFIDAIIGEDFAKGHNIKC